MSRLTAAAASASLVAVVITGGIAPSNARAAAVASIYPPAEVGLLSYSPSSLKFGSGSMFHVKRWRNWGKAKAVGIGYFCDHCNLKRPYVRAKGKLVLGGAKNCGADRIYTTYRLAFKGTQRRKAKWWLGTKVRTSAKKFGCGPGGTNAQAFMPSYWNVAAEYLSEEDFLPRFAPAEQYLSSSISVKSSSAWAGWGTPATTASGAATIYDAWPECAGGADCARTVTVAMTASDLGHCGTHLMYRQVSVQPIVADPSFAGWSDSLQTRSVSCFD
ncbi:MAG: hypothetical protein ACRDKE_04470 [Solirubrobacterales bacterium]